MKSNEGLPEIGYWIGKEYTKRGIAKTALRQLTNLAHEKLEIPTIALEIREDNIGSQRVAAGAGYELVQEGATREGYTIPFSIWHSVHHQGHLNLCGPQEEHLCDTSK
jgi:RimJ/RimL family protein N-acetyltransferase